MRIQNITKYLGDVMAKYGKKSQDSVKGTVKTQKQAKLKSGKSGKTVTSRKQAGATGLSKKGAKVPKKKSTTTKKSTTAKKSTTKKSATSKKASKA